MTINFTDTEYHSLLRTLYLEHFKKIEDENVRLKSNICFLCNDKAVVACKECLNKCCGECSYKYYNIITCKICLSKCCCCGDEHNIDLDGCVAQNYVTCCDKYCCEKCIYRGCFTVRNICMKCELEIFEKSDLGFPQEIKDFMKSPNYEKMLKLKK